MEETIPTRPMAHASHVVVRTCIERIGVAQWMQLDGPKTNGWGSKIWKPGVLQTYGGWKKHEETLHHLVDGCFFHFNPIVIPVSRYRLLFAIDAGSLPSTVARGPLCSQVTAISTTDSRCFLAPRAVTQRSSSTQSLQSANCRCRPARVFNPAGFNLKVQNMVYTCKTLIPFEIMYRHMSFMWVQCAERRGASVPPCIETKSWHS